MIGCVTRHIREYFTGKESDYVFKRTDHVKPAKLNAINLYIHIPFCKNICPYCPYFKVGYNPHKASAYLKAVIREIEMYSNIYGNVNIPSIYIGGGTPTLLIDELAIILKNIRYHFNVTGEICIELNPNDVTSQLISKLKDCNANLVSLGAQSFLDKHLEFIERKYKSGVVKKALEQLVKAEFNSLNIDLMFALPKQNVADLAQDLDKAIMSGVNQITTYPLFTFPYTSMGEFLKLKKVRMPSLFKRREQYYFLHEYLAKRGFKRVSVWGFKKGDVPRYSSVTREHYIGLGAGSGSHLPDGFYLNVFSVEEYIKKCFSNKLPLALYMKFTEDMQKYFWLYWRLYDTCIKKDELFNRFGLDDRKMTNLITRFKQLKLIVENNENYELTMRGAFWVHLMQNMFSLKYINKVWNRAIQEPYPSEIRL